MRNVSCVFLMSCFLLVQQIHAATYEFIHRSLNLSSNQTRTVTVQKIDNQTLYLKVSPIFFSNDAIYEATYQIRRNNPGDRLGNREFWRLPTDAETQAMTTVETDCKVDSSKPTFELHLKLHFNLQTKNLKNWHQLFCLSQDREAFALILPELKKILVPQIAQLITFQTKLREKYLQFEMDKNWDYLSHSLSIIETLVIETQKSTQDTRERDFILSNQVSRFHKNLIYDSALNITKPFVVVTHASSQFDLNKSIQPFASEILSKAQQKKLPIYFLMHNDSEFDFSWFLDQTSPTQAFFSKNGEHNLNFSSNQVILMGGFYSECLRTTQIDLITRYFLNHQKPLQINLPISAIYAHNSIRFDQISKKEFIKNAIEGSIFGGYEIEDDHGGLVENDMTRLTGLPDLNQCQLQIYTNDELIYTVGEGHRIVQLRFWTDSEFQQLLKGIEI